MVSPSPPPSEEAGDGHDGQQPEPSFEPWQEALRIFEKSQDSGKPVKQRYLAVIKEANYNENSGALTVTLDKVTWNPKYSDGNDEDPILNPLVKWETVGLGEVAVLVDAAGGLSRSAIEPPRSARRFGEFWPVDGGRVLGWPQMRSRGGPGRSLRSAPLRVSGACPAGAVEMLLGTCPVGGCHQGGPYSCSPQPPSAADTRATTAGSPAK